MNAPQKPNSSKVFLSAAANVRQNVIYSPHDAEHIASNTILDAVRIVSYSSVYADVSKYPVERGNYFSVSTSNSIQYSILNFYVENLIEVIRRGIKWPIKIMLMSNSHAVIHDERIPDSWYCERFIETCAPIGILPIPQRLTHLRQIARGQRNETERGIKIDFDKIPTLKVD